MAETFDKIAEQIKKSEYYQKDKRNLQHALNRAILSQSFYTMLDLVSLCNVKISISDLLKLADEAPTGLSNEVSQVDFITAVFQEHGIDVNGWDIEGLGRIQLTLCMNIATILWYDENL